MMTRKFQVAHLTYKLSGQPTEPLLLPALIPAKYDVWGMFPTSPAAILVNPASCIVPEAGGDWGVEGAGGEAGAINSERETDRPPPPCAPTAYRIRAGVNTNVD